MVQTEGHELALMAEVQPILCKDKAFLLYIQELPKKKILLLMK